MSDPKPKWHIPNLFPDRPPLVQIEESERYSNAWCARPFLIDLAIASCPKSSESPELMEQAVSDVLEGWEQAGDLLPVHCEENEWWFGPYDLVEFLNDCKKAFRRLAGSSN